MFDCCIINDELDILELRFDILFPFVEKFVVVESDKTHSGKSKELNFEKNKDRFKKFQSKIIYMVYKGHNVINSAQAWGNENFQRNYVLESLKICKPTDNLLFVSDVDEIPKPEKLIEAKCVACKSNMPVAFNMYNCMYYFNFAADSVFRGPYLYNPYNAESVHKSFGNSRYDPTTFRWHMCAVEFEKDFPIVNDAGWHFSTLGGIDAIRHKLESYAHIEFNTPEIRAEEHLLKCIAEGMPYNEDKYKFSSVKSRFTKREISFLPEYVQYNLDKYKNYILF
jgi:beta-1,4-mannosyl-glycoprotein beta-1,4-N-acetylglucosaminyltransferase